MVLPATELFTRTLMPQDRDTVLDIVEEDNVVGYTFRPGATAVERGRDYDVEYRINSLGLRDREYVLDELGDSDGKGVYRVLLIGNSFCVSHGLEIEESVSRALEEVLARALSEDDELQAVEVINTSNAGYNAYNYWKSYERWGPVFRPDAVVVGFVPTREHLSDPDDIRFVVQDGLVVGRYRADEQPVIASPSVIQVVRKTLSRNSDFYVLMRNFFYYNERVAKILDSDGGLGGTSRLVDPYRKDPSARVTEGFGLALTYLDLLREETARDGVSLLVLGIPQKADVLDSAWDVAQAKADEIGVEVDRLLPSRRLAAHCLKAEIPFIDLAPALQKVGAKGFFEHDNHWNSIGVGAAAEMIGELWGDDLLNHPMFPKAGEGKAIPDSEHP